MNKVLISPANAEHIDAIVALLPRLADFDVPVHRVATDLWHGDADLLRAWASGQRGDVSVCIAVDETGNVLGVAAASEREDLLSHAPSAHLEVLSVAGHAERQGLGHRLLASIEQIMREKGATGMSLHVFGNNHRARALYAKEGFDEEIVRCFKPFD